MSELFNQIASFARRPRKVVIAAPDDIESTESVWSEDQLMLPLHQRGDPASHKYTIRAGAETQEVEIVPLSMADRLTADSITDAAVPPRIVTEEPPDKPGGPVRKVLGDFDEEDPAYFALIRPLRDKQNAYIVLKGVLGLEASIPADDDAARITILMRTWPSVLVRYLAGMIYNISFAGGDPADFFIKEGSSSTPSSEPSLKPNPKATKRK